MRRPSGGVMEWTVLVDTVLLVGVAVVLPLALGHWRRWALAAVAVALSLLLPSGPVAAVVASGWAAIAAWTFLAQVKRVDRHRAPVLDELVLPFASGFALVAATAFVASRADLTLMGIGEPIVELTAVHFTYAGVGALTLAGAVARRGPRTRSAAVVLTLVAPPVVALGFVAHHPIPQVGGAVLMSAGVLVTASYQLRDAVTDSPDRRGWLIVSGLAPWAPMALAVAWASALYWDVPALSIPDMARTHGVANMVFVIAGLLARRPTRRTERAMDPVVPAIDRPAAP